MTDVIEAGSCPRIPLTKHSQVASFSMNSVKAQLPLRPRLQVQIWSVLIFRVCRDLPALRSIQEATKPN
jgi:hypothetical protein